MTTRRIPEPASLPTHRLADALSELPLFPLPEVVLFPRAVLPLHVFEPRYRDLVRDARLTHGALSVVQDAPDDAGGAEGRMPRIPRVAGAGIIIEHEPLSDGRSNILVHGTARVALEELPFVGPYRRARATILEDRDELVSDADAAALIHAATSFAGEVRRRDPRFSFRLPEAPAPAVLADLCAFHLVIDAAARQAILEDLDPRSRVLRVLRELSAQRLELEGPPTAGSGTAN